MGETLDNVLYNIAAVALCVFVVLLVNGVRFTMELLHDARYGRVEIDDEEDPESPTSVADF